MPGAHFFVSRGWFCLTRMVLYLTRIYQIEWIILSNRFASRRWFYLTQIYQIERIILSNGCCCGGEICWMTLSDRSVGSVWDYQKHLCEKAGVYQHLRSWLAWWLSYTTPVAALPQCGANHKSASPRLSGVVNLLDNLIG